MLLLLNARNGAVRFRYVLKHYGKMITAILFEFFDIM